MQIKDQHCQDYKVKDIFSLLPWQNVDRMKADLLNLSCFQLLPREEYPSFQFHLPKPMILTDNYSEPLPRILVEFSSNLKKKWPDNAYAYTYLKCQKLLLMDFKPLRQEGGWLLTPRTATCWSYNAEVSVQIPGKHSNKWQWRSRDRFLAYVRKIHQCYSWFGSCLS